MSGWKNWNGKKITKQTEQAFGQALLEATEAIGDISQQQVPHDSGALSKTKVVLQDPNNPLEVFIGYGGGGNSGMPYIPYAVKWHELPADFQKGRKHNYLRDPVRNRGAELVRKSLVKQARKVW